MNPQVLLSRLRERGITVEVDGPDLVVDGPKTALTDAVVDVLRRFKPVLVAHLRGSGGCSRCGSAEYRDVPLMHPPHNGQSTRRDCVQCVQFIDFVRWYGNEPSRN